VVACEEREDSIEAGHAVDEESEGYELRGGAERNDVEE
jgi:hypothetical protein